MKFDSAAEVEQVVWYMRVSDWPRANNRALIDNLFNGFPPYTPEEWARMKATSAVNVNFLESTKIAADARMQYQNAFLKPGNFFTVQLEHGDRNHRQEWSNKITEKLSRVMKKSLKYRECKRNIFAQLVLHGVGPQLWSDRESWVPSMQMMGDVLIPTQTLLTMENLSYFAVYRRYTPGELWRKTHGPRVDPAWNIETAEACCKWAHDQWGQTTSQNDGIWAPERWAENMKEMAGMWSSDAVPTINAFDFYYLHNEGKNFGWRRKIILDSPSVSPANRNTKPSMSQAKNFLEQEKSQFLYDGGKRNYAPSLDQIFHCQFADGSVVAPFRYHSVRSLGFLLYSVCHLQNRMRCKLNEAVFESMQQYMQGINPDDSERATKIDLIDKGILPDGVRFVPQNERWQVNEGLVMNGLSLNRQSMADNSASFTQNFGEQTKEGRGPEKTATQIAAEVNSANALVGAMLQTAYGYAEAEYREIARRFCIKNSKDKDVREFRLACLKEGVPEELLNHELWDISVTKVMGSGNKQVELGQSQMLMQQIDRYDPDSQRSILRQYTFSATDDESMAERLVPAQQNMATDSVHDAQVSAATLLRGLPMALKQGVNHGEYAAALLAAMQAEIALIEQNGAMATPDQIAGLQNIAGQSVEGEPIYGNGAANHIQIVAQNKASQQDAKMLMDVLGKNLNMVKAYIQRLQEQQGEQAAQVSPEAQAKIISAQIVADQKAENMRAANELKLQQKQQGFEQKSKQDMERHEMEQAKAIRGAQVQEAVTDLEAAAKIGQQAEQAQNAPPAEKSA